MHGSSYVLMVFAVVLLCGLHSCTAEVMVYKDQVALASSGSVDPPVSVFSAAPVPESPVTKVDFSAAPRSGRTPLMVMFTDLTAGTPSHWEWDFGDGETSGGENPVHTYRSPGSYTVTLTASGEQGSGTCVKEGYIQAGPIPLKANFTATPARGPAPLTVRFTDTSEGAMIWLWNFGDGSTGSMIPDPMHTFLEDGAYTVSLKVDNQVGDTDTMKQEIIVSSELTADFEASPRIGTAPLQVTFTPLTTGSPVSWLWDFGDGETSQSERPVHQYRTTGTYSVNLTVTDAQGQKGTRTKEGFITVTGSGQGKIPLSSGWNLVSVPAVLAPGSDTAQIFRQINVAGHSILRYDPVAGWTTLTPSSPVKPLDAYWVYSAGLDTVPLVFDLGKTPLPRSLPAGWSMAGTVGLTPRDAGSSLSSVRDQWSYCLGYNAEMQQYREMIIRGSNDGTLLSPYHGFWLYLSDPGLLQAS